MSKELLPKSAIGVGSRFVYDDKVYNMIKTTPDAGCDECQFMDIVKRCTVNTGVQKQCVNIFLNTGIRDFKLVIIE